MLLVALSKQLLFLRASVPVVQEVCSGYQHPPQELGSMWGHNRFCKHSETPSLCQAPRWCTAEWQGFFLFFSLGGVTLPWRSCSICASQGVCFPLPSCTVTCLSSWCFSIIPAQTWVPVEVQQQQLLSVLAFLGSHSASGFKLAVREEILQD